MECSYVCKSVCHFHKCRSKARSNLRGKYAIEYFRLRSTASRTPTSPDSIDRTVHASVTGLQLDGRSFARLTTIRWRWTSTNTLGMKMNTLLKSLNQRHLPNVISFHCHTCHYNLTTVPKWSSYHSLDSPVSHCMI